MGASGPVLAKAMRAFRADDSGATAAEYGMIACGVALVVVVMVGSGLSPLDNVYRKAATIAEVLAGDGEAIAVPSAVAGSGSTGSNPDARPSESERSP